MTTAQQRSALGQYGEARAARHLIEQGMVVLDRNWRCDLGEIDLVLRDGDLLVVCEVKTRSSNDYGTPLESVTPVKAARLRRLAARWAHEHEVRCKGIRIDLVGVLRPRQGPSEVRHVRGIG